MPKQKKAIESAAKQIENLDAKLKSKTSREKLPLRTKPYCVIIAPKLALCYYRKPNGKPGRWAVRVEAGRDAKNNPERKYRGIALADDIAPANGRDILSYPQARIVAATRPADVDDGPSKKTVRQAVEAYVAHKRNASDAAADDALAKLRRPVLCNDAKGKPIPGCKGLADYVVTDLTLQQLESWRDALVRHDPKDPEVARKSRSTINRMLSSFRSALNRAVREDEAHGIHVRTAWRLLEDFKDVERARAGNFSEDDVQRLIRKARKQDPCFANLIEAAAHTGARPPGDLAKLDVKDFDADAATIQVHKGKTRERVTYLTPEGVKFFMRLSKGKQPDDILLPKADGTRWGKSHHHRPMQAALKAAKLTGCMYLLRRSYVKRARVDGIPDSAIAENVGTSIKMMEQTYGKRTSAEQRAMIERMGLLMRPKFTPKLITGGKRAA